MMGLTSPRWRNQALYHHRVASEGRPIWTEPAHGGGHVGRGNCLWGRGLVAWGCMRTVGVEVLQPTLDRHLGVSELVEEFNVASLVPQIAVETLGVADLTWAAESGAETRPSPSVPAPRWPRTLDVANGCSTR